MKDFNDIETVDFADICPGVSRKKPRKRSV